MSESSSKVLLKMSESSSNSHFLHLLDLPNEMLQEVMAYLKYDEIAKCRAVCKKFDRNGRQMLNRGFQLVTNQLAKYKSHIDSKLPRRRSERIKHPLQDHSLSITTIRIRLNKLQRHYHPYIETGICCFIAGKVIDEAIKAFHNVTITENRTKFITSGNLGKYVDMAVDHFEDVVEPSLQSMSGNKLARDMDDSEESSSEISENSTSRSDCTSESIEKSRKTVESLHYRIAKNRVAMLHMKKQVSKLRLKVNDNKPSRMRLQIFRLQQQNQKKDKQLKILKKRLRLERRNNVRTQK